MSFSWAREMKFTTHDSMHRVHSLWEAHLSKRELLTEHLTFFTDPRGQRDCPVNSQFITLLNISAFLLFPAVNAVQFASTLLNLSCTLLFFLLKKHWLVCFGPSGCWFATNNLQCFQHAAPTNSGLLTVSCSCLSTWCRWRWMHPSSRIPFIDNQQGPSWRLTRSGLGLPTDAAC